MTKHQQPLKGHSSVSRKQQQQHQEPTMVNSSTGSTDAGPRPKPIFFWNNADVMKWLKRHCEEYYGLYGEMFHEHEITGRSLVRMTEVTLERMGIQEAEHRDELCRIMLKLKLKSDILEMKDLEKRESGASAPVPPISMESSG